MLTLMPKLNSINLSKNIIRSIQAQVDMPPLEAFPKSHQVTFKYYVGVVAFLQEDYVQVYLSSISIKASSADAPPLGFRQKKI